MVLGIFQITLCLNDRYVFMRQSSGNFERFQYFNSETNFLENENLFQKTVVLFYSWKC